MCDFRHSTLTWVHIFLNFKPDDLLKLAKYSKDPPFRKEKISISPSGYDGILLGATHDDASKDWSINSFQLLRTLSEWVEPWTTTKCLTVAVFLPSGGGPGEFSVCVVDEVWN